MTLPFVLLGILGILSGAGFLLGGRLGGDGADADATPGATTATEDPASTVASRRSYIRTRVTPGGIVETTQQVVAAQPVSSLRVTVWSAPAEGAAGAFDFYPWLRRLEITGDGLPVSHAPGSLRAGEVIEVPLSAPATVIRLHFRGGGQLMVTDDSSPDRALVLLNAADIGVEPANESMTARLSGAQVLNLACASPGETPKACGDTDRHGWYADVSTTTEVAVVAQVDLGQP